MAHLFEKLQQARVQLQEMNLKKSGNNKFAGYDYFEVQDFLPSINKIFNELKLFSQLNYTQEVATLTIYNSEDPTQLITFTSPMAGATLKGCHEVQNLGASISYLKRYLWMIAMEITESDQLDAVTGKEDRKQTNTTQYAPKQQQQPKASDKQKTLIDAKLAKMGTALQLSKSEILHKMNVKDVENLTNVQASELINKLMSWEKSQHG